MYVNTWQRWHHSDAIFVVCSHTFTLFWLRKTSETFEIFRWSFHVFTCAFPSVISSIFGKSFPFPFACFVLLFHSLHYIFRCYSSITLNFYFCYLCNFSWSEIVPLLFCNLNLCILRNFLVPDIVWFKWWYVLEVLQGDVFVTLCSWRKRKMQWHRSCIG